MDFSLSGHFENALIREVTAQGDRSAIQTDHPYYQGLYRYTPKAYFDRCGTFIAIADTVSISGVDWTFQQGIRDREIAEEEFGLRKNGIDQDKSQEIRQFAALLLRRRAFSSPVARMLRTVTGPSERPIASQRLRVFPVGTVDGFALDYLTRLLDQVYASATSRSLLVISDDERAILNELCAFLVRTRLSSPIDLPDLRATTAIDGNDFAGGLLNFSPPDAASVAAVRADKSISQYAAAVREALGSPSSLDSQRNALVKAMREALGRSDSARRVERVFEVVSWAAKPLHYVPGVDSILSLGEDAVDLAKKWVGRKEASAEWFLLGAKMTDVAIKDYLNRTGNF